MSTRASHGKVKSTDLLGSMFANSDIKRTEDGAPLSSFGNRPASAANKEASPAPLIWDELKNIHQQCVQGLQIYSGIRDLKDRKDIFLAMTPPERATYVSLATRLANDLGAYDRDLQTIYDLHKDKSGSESDPDAAKQWIQIVEQYEHFRTQAESVLSQTYLQLAEIVKEAETRSAKLEDPSNPDIITDVVIEEITNVADEEVASS
jgi:hypothetical protein